jgi:prepilin peptidase CpaA
LSPASEAIVLGTLAASVGTAAVIDIRTRRIPNWLTLGSAVAGLALAATGASGISPGWSLLGLIAGGLLMMPGHVLGATGAGDVKLLAAVGAIVGLGSIGMVFLWSAIAGGILAIGVGLWRRRLGLTLRRTACLVVAPGTTKADVESSGANNRFAYAPAIALGALLATLFG